MSPLFIMLLCPVKKLSCLNRERNMHLYVKTVQKSCKQISLWILMWETTGDGLSLEEALLWIMALNEGFFFLPTCRFSLHKMLTDGLEWCGLLEDCCDVFISCLDSHSGGTHSLQRIHWWASDAKFLLICSDEETNSPPLSL